MAAPAFAFLLCMTIGGTFGSESEPSSISTNQEDMTSLKLKMLRLEDRMSSLETSIPQTLQAETEQLLITVLDELEIKLENYARANNVSEMGEALRKGILTLLSDHSLRVKQLQDDVEQMDQNQRNQTSLIERLSQQLEDVQNTCIGEPPSPQNGMPLDFERKHGSDVRYRCDVHFVQTGNSSVRCHFGKWEGRPPLCTRQAFLDSSLILHLSHLTIAHNVSCSSGEKDRKMDFIRVLDTGTGLFSLPTGAKTYSRGGAAVLDLSGVEAGDRGGVYECGYQRHGKREGIPLVFQRGGWFLRPQVASTGANVTLSFSNTDDPSYRWLHDGDSVPAWDGRAMVKLTGVRREDAGIYELYKEGNRRGTQWFYRLFVRGCPANFFGESCEKNCATCHNGGVCHDLLGTCVCPTGFKGEQCEVACGQNRIGPNCTESCDGGDCKWHIFCKPDPYGCSCAPGYWGLFCELKCEKGNFGPDCRFSCHCASAFCDPHTGVCPGGCSQGWTGPSCQIRDSH